MRVIREYQYGAVMQSNIHADQYSSLAARAGEAWNEWEIQMLVMASFFLQVFLLVSAPFRKRHRSSMLSGSLWIAYLMADYVATYLLGRLTLLVALAAGGGTRQQLALFWAPFLLLHLGGQETITAFSMEDNTLWKRRLLDLGSQVAMAVYLVGKQWRGDNDRLLVAPMVLMFIIGAAKYGERIWALRAASLRSSSNHKGVSSGGSESAVMDHYNHLVSMSSSEGKMRIERVLEEASINFSGTLDFFMDVIPSEQSGFSGKYDEIKSALIELKSSKNRDGVAYKLAEMQLSLIHDYLYTKFGTVRFRAPKPLNPITGSALQWLASLGLTSVALVLFAWASSRSHHYNGADVLISYILLVGAIVMEVSSIFIALLSSCWAGTGVAKLLHLHAGEMWSGKMPQYNMVDDCVQERERQAASGGVVGKALRWMLASCQTTPPHVVVSPDVKKLLLNNVLEIAIDLRNHYWEFSRFQGQWAMWVASRVDGGSGSGGGKDDGGNGGHKDGGEDDSGNGDGEDDGGIEDDGANSGGEDDSGNGGGDDDGNDHPAGPASKALSTSRIKETDFVSSVVLWHLVTRICLRAGDGPSELRSPCKDLSNYIMYLVAKCSVMVDSDGHIVIDRSVAEVQGSRLDRLREVGWIPRDVPDFLNELHQEDLIQKLREGDKEYGSSIYLSIYQNSRAPSTARRVCVELLKIPEARARWELIAAVWTEILCYMALNCGAAFHAKHLTTGGEFLTQAKMLLYIIRLPFLIRNLWEVW